ncbi:MAG: transcription antitermination protein NusB, partial [Flavobacteriia bacterium]|nr:transcription antitermination protein NusB [Flavobacteriia bacterium]
FVHKLLLNTIQKEREYEDIIASTASNWDVERIAKMDMIMLKMGISELLHFQSIPTNVTLNEYIEISKFYSTPKSNIFINGILDQIINQLKRENRILKTGRGLLN